MNWFDFKEDYSGERDSYGLTLHDREEQRSMLLEEMQNSNEPADDSPETRFTVYRGRL